MSPRRGTGVETLGLPPDLHRAPPSQPCSLVHCAANATVLVSTSTPYRMFLDSHRRGPHVFRHQTRSTIQIVTAPVWGVRFSVCLVAERCGVPGSLSLSALLSHNGDVCACVGQPRPNGAAVSRQCQHERKTSSPAVLRGSPEPGMRSRRMKTFIFSYKTKRTAIFFACGGLGLPSAG